jgi:hypothetical protein
MLSESTKYAQNIADLKHKVALLDAKIDSSQNDQSYE